MPHPEARRTLPFEVGSGDLRRTKDRERSCRFSRAALVVLLAVMLVFSVPGASAAPAFAVAVHFDVVGVKAHQSVTIRTRDFPIRTKFTARIDVIGRGAENGPVVSEFNTEQGGVLEMSLSIPEALRNELILAVRVESKDGYLATNWFINEDMAYKPKDPQVKPALSFTGVKKNQSVTVAGKNFPPGFSFAVRAGPYYTFYRDYVTFDRVTAAADGTLKFDLALPEKFKDADYIMVRVDGTGAMAYGTFQNADGGAAVSDSKLYKVVDCTLLDLNPIPPLDPRADFDVIWTVQNSGIQDWDNRHVVFRFMGGEKMHKYDDTQTLPWTIKRGGVFQFVVDMRAPETSGWHTASWYVMQVANGDKTFCKLKVNVYVK
jgi:hypothetical protein